MARTAAIGSGLLGCYWVYTFGIRGFRPQWKGFYLLAAAVLLVGAIGLWRRSVAFLTVSAATAGIGFLVCAALIAKGAVSNLFLWVASALLATFAAVVVEALIARTLRPSRDRS